MLSLSPAILPVSTKGDSDRLPQLIQNCVSCHWAISLVNKTSNQSGRNHQSDSESVHKRTNSFSPPPFDIRHSETGLSSNKIAFVVGGSLKARPTPKSHSIGIKYIFTLVIEELQCACSERYRILPPV
ncbi:hypothetical protein CDAR_33421 [Caerostris darwini]|uniref:Uncharacterized protein n=1 Tax=Caerostris darwini TaxID=1538125 RepID=A0AAV4VF71_9ARAC|nr:hypothetical protein CDAR_33421 [Caerostris darwini]